MDDDDEEHYPDDDLGGSMSRKEFRENWRPQYQYVNSERDFTLPLQKHQNVQPMYESPEEGESSLNLVYYLLLKCIALLVFIIMKVIRNPICIYTCS